MNEFIVRKVFSKKQEQQQQQQQQQQALGALLQCTPTPNALDQLLVEIKDALQQYKATQVNFTNLVRYGTAEMVTEALAVGTPDPHQPSKHGNDITYPIIEAIRKGDIEIVRLLLNSKVSLAVQDIECSAGCGFGCSKKSSPLGEALQLRHKEIALLLIQMHPSLKSDIGIKNCGGDGDQEMSPAALVKEWGDKDLLKALEEKHALGNIPEGFALKDEPLLMEAIRQAPL